VSQCRSPSRVYHVSTTTFLCPVDQSGEGKGVDTNALHLPWRALVSVRLFCLSSFLVGCSTIEQSTSLFVKLIDGAWVFFRKASL
jgi:hypothetical protein